MSHKASLTPLKMLLFSFHATNTIIISFLPLYLKAKGLNPTEIGWVLAIGPLASIFSQPFWGYMSDKYKTVKRMLLICVTGLIISSIVFFQMNSLLAILLMGAIFYFFTSPIGGLGDSLAQRRANELSVSFGTIRTWGSIGFATSSLIIGEFLQRTSIEYMIYPYVILGIFALIITFRLTDIKVDSEPIHLKDVKQLLTNKPYIQFLLFMMFLTITHRANDSYIGIFIDQLGGGEQLVGLSWFVSVISEAAIFATAGWWFRKYHPLVFVIISGFFFSLRWFLFSAADSPLDIIGLQFLHGLTFAVFYLAAFDYITRLLPKLLESTGHLIYYSVFFGVSGIIGSLVGGTIIDATDAATLYNSMGWLASLGTIGLLTYYIVSVARRTQTRG